MDFLTKMILLWQLKSYEKNAFVNQNAPQTMHVQNTDTISQKGICRCTTKKQNTFYTNQIKGLTYARR